VPVLACFVGVAAAAPTKHGITGLERVKAFLKETLPWWLDHICCAVQTHTHLIYDSEVLEDG
jgi:hypothetical protein